MFTQVSDVLSSARVTSQQKSQYGSQSDTRHEHGHQIVKTSSCCKLLIRALERRQNAIGKDYA